MKQEGVKSFNLQQKLFKQLAFAFFISYPVDPWSEVKILPYII